MLTIPTAWARSFINQSKHSAEVAALCSLNAHSKSAIALGKKYLSAHPEYRDPQLIAQEIFSDWSYSERNLALSKPHILKDMFRKKVRQDFRLQNVSSLNGWVLADSELRQWALLALVAS